MSSQGDRTIDSVLAAISAVTGQPLAMVTSAFTDRRAAATDDTRLDDREIRQFMDRVSTRLGLAPAVTTDQAAAHRQALAELTARDWAALTRGDLRALSQTFRQLPEEVPTLARDRVVFPPLPAHQVAMWQTLIELEQVELPWVLVGGQMTMLHCLENGVSPSRTTDDGDIALNVWVRRGALRVASRFLRDRGFVEDATSDGFGYRFRRDETTVIDVLLPEGLERQHDYPTTTTGRPGVSTEGANQALSRTERVPVRIDGVDGHIRRPNVLGAIVLKATAHRIDSRDVDRHAQDVVVLTEIALQDPRATLSRVTAHDRRRVRPFVRNLTPGHRYLRQATDGEAVLAFLTRLVAEQA